MMTLKEFIDAVDRGEIHGSNWYGDGDGIMPRLVDDGHGGWKHDGWQYVELICEEGGETGWSGFVYDIPPGTIVD